MALKQLQAVHHSGERDMDTVRVICLHSTEGETAAGAAGWFANQNSLGSAHICVDGKEGFRCLPDNVQPWANGWNKTLDMEHAARAAWARTRWLTPDARRMLRRSAWHVALWCYLYDIQPYWLTPMELRAGKSGVTSHINISVAFHTSTHTDPGKGFPRLRYMKMVRSELKARRNG